MRPICSAASMLCVAALLLVSAPHAAVAQETLCGKPKSSPQALYEHLAKVDKLREMGSSPEYVALEDGTDGTLWTFTLPAHPAHPAVVCRRIVERRGMLDIPTSIQCNGPQAACAKLESDFETLNKRMIQELYDQQRQQQQQRQQK